MNREQIENNYRHFCELVAHHQIKDALDILNNLIAGTDLEDYKVQFEKNKNTYENILQYTFKGIKDPQRHKIYNHLLTSILELADRVKQTALMQSFELKSYDIKKRLEKQVKLTKEDALRIVEELSVNLELTEILKSSSVLDEEKQLLEDKKRKQTLNDIFNRIWLTDRYNESDIELIRSINKAINIPWHEKSLFVSALTLSVLRCFDENKIYLLFEIQEDYQEQIWQRALTGLILALYSYDKRLHLYPDIINKLNEFNNNEQIEKDIEAIIIQLIKSKDTEKVTKKLHNEIIPEVIKLKPKLEEKLDLENILSDEHLEDEEKSSKWETFFEDSPNLYEKMEELSKLQMEGADIFMSAFAMLKHFEFFQNLSNWFLPFYKENETLKESLKNEKKNFNTEQFIEAMESTPFLCNSDKYSYCLNVVNIPEAHKSMMMELFIAEINDLNEVTKEEEKLDSQLKSRYIYTQYIQDLYRFFKLHPLKQDFQDIFNMKLDIHNTLFFNHLSKGSMTLRNIGDFYFEKNYFEEAQDIYSSLNKMGDNNLEILEKIAYCHQKLKNYEEALKFYHKAELFDNNRAWNLKKIGLCYRNLKNPKKALKYYLEAEKLEPENLYLQTHIGHCYFDLRNYEKALKYYFKVEYLAPSNKKVLRPIAWCSFVLGKFDAAKKYYKLLIEKDGHKYDYMNLGHVQWCTGNTQKAIEYYKKSFTQADNKSELISTLFNDDKDYLVNHGIDPDEIPLMIDYLKYLIG